MQEELLTRAFLLSTLHSDIVEKKVYSFEEHLLAQDQIDSHALYVMEKLRSAGFVAYLVGGSVRDLLLGHKPKDFDISTSAKPEEIRSLFRNSLLIGRRFRLAHIRFGKKVLEVSTFRSGDVENESLIIRDNQWGYPEEDALRRDFTINGLFYDSATQTIIDYVGGFEDLKKKMLRTIGPAYARFKQDPVRMIRLLKFRARFDFGVDSVAHIALLESRSEIVKSSQARVLEEMLRMLESGASQPFIRLMADHGLLAHLLPELTLFLEKEGGNDVYSLLQEVDSQLRDPQRARFDRALLLSCLVYPILQQHVKEHYLEQNILPHLGQIQAHIQQLLNLIFHGFFLLPRRLRQSMLSILIGQYRLVPLEQKKMARKRVPQDPDFPLAVEFLELRSSLEPALQIVCEEWKTLVGKTEKTERPARRRPRRRRRREP